MLKTFTFWLFLPEFHKASCVLLGSCKTKWYIVCSIQHNIFLLRGTMWLMGVNMSTKWWIVWTIPHIWSIPHSRVEPYSYSLVPNVTHRSIETHACTLGESIGLNYPHAWTNGKLLCGKKHTTNNFVSHNPIETHDFKISSCQKCDFQLNHTTDLHF